MPKERWFANDWELTQGIVRDVESVAGLSQTPPMVGKNAEVAGRRGTIWVPKVHGPGRFVINVWMGDESSESERDALWDQMVRVMCSPHRLVTFRRVMRDGSTRICYGEVVSQVAAEPIGIYAYRAGFEVHVPAGVWEGATKTVTATVSGNPAIIPLTAFQNSTAALDALTVRVSGGGAGITIGDGGPFPSRDQFTYNEGIGGTLVVNAGTFDVTGEGMTPNQEAIRYPAARYLTVHPGVPGRPPALKVTNGSGATITVTGKELFAC